MRSRSACPVMVSGMLTVLLAVAVLGAQHTHPPVAVAAQADVAGLVDIGDSRQLYLECRGTGSPTVVLEVGYRASARYWSDDLLQPAAPRTMVLPGIAAFTRVCAYDRPGTIAAPADDQDDVRISRSDPVAQPRTATEIVADLHALLHAAGVPRPYVLAAHSLGSLFARLYASTYPDEVSGLVLVDAYSERIESLLTPEQWQALVRFNVTGGSDTIEPILGYGDLETLGYGSSDAVMRRAAAVSPLRAMPLAVLARGQAFALTQAALGFSPETLETALRAATTQLVMLVPNVRLFIAHNSGHDIHQDQPQLVIEAIRQVVEGARQLDTWYDLTSCCTH